MDLLIPKDAFSDGQVRSKLWLVENLNKWTLKYLDPAIRYTLSWYGSWIGLGPFLVLCSTKLNLLCLNLIELDQDALRNSASILEHWSIHGLEVNFINADMNVWQPNSDAAQLFINTACEHLLETEWLSRLPRDSFVLLQSTDMVHEEHINCPKDLNDFINIYSPFIKILDCQKLDFSYPGKSFSRFMLFGQKCN